MKNNIYIGILILLMTFSCKKKEFPIVVNSSSTDYIFRVDGQIDNDDISFAAGGNGNVLTTDFVTIGEDNFILNATFGESECIDCTPRLKISMNTNSGKYYNEAFEMSNFSEGIYNYQPCTLDIDRIVLSEELSLNSGVNGAIVNGFYAGINPYELVDIDAPVEINYQYLGSEITVNNNHWFLFSNECEVTTHSVDVFPINYSASSGLINITPPIFEFPGNYSWLLTYEMNGNIILDTLLQSSNSVSEVNFSVANVLDQIDQFFLTMVYSGDNGNMIIERQNNISSAMDFIVPVIPIEAFDVGQLSAPTFEIEYIDENGIRYVTSENCLDFHDNVENTFTVLSVEDYGVDAQGIPTIKLEFSTNCTLINPETMETIEVQNFQGTIALPVPKD